MADKLIDIKKIVRNKSKANTTNGEMDEIINLRNEDGNWKPLPANVEIWQSLTANQGIANYSQIFIHTGKDYKHVLGIEKVTHRIMYLGNVVGNDVECNLEPIYTTVTASADRCDIHQVGNLLCINDYDYVKYLLWKDGEYKSKSADMNELDSEGFLAPDGLSQLRVVPTCDENGVPKILVTYGNLSENQFTSWDSVKEEAAANGLSMIAQVRKIAKECGMLNGFTVGVVAYKLYDGSYTFASRPILLSQPCDDGTRYEKQYGFEDVADVCKSNSSHVFKNSVIQDDMPIIKTNGKAHSYRYNPKAMNVVWQKNSKYAPEKYSLNKRSYYWNSTMTGAVGKMSDDKKTEACKENCEIYWDGGEQGLNVGEQFKEGVVDSGGQDKGVVSYGELPLYKRDMSKDESDDNIPVGFDMFSMTVRKKSKNYYNCFQEIDSTVSLRGSMMQEITVPYEERLKSGYRNFEMQRGCDCFNPPNAFSVVHCEPANNNDTCHNFISGARKVKNVDQVYGFAMTNQLQVKVGQYSPDFADVISDVCVFISSEVYSADENKGTAINVPLTDVCRVNKHTNGTAVKVTGATIYANPKEDKKLSQDIKDIPVLYKVWEKPYKNIDTNNWIDIDLSDVLNILEECETLNVDAISCRNSLKAKCSYLYNGRLHLGNIEEKYFDGFPLSYFEMADQWKKSAYTNYSRSLASAYDFRDTGGKNTNLPAFKYIGDEQTPIYVAYFATISTDAEGHNTITKGNLYTSDTYGSLVRYIDSDSGQYYTTDNEDVRYDITTAKFDYNNGTTWTTVDEFIMQEPGTSDDDGKFIVFRVTPRSSIDFTFDEDKISESGHKYYTHHDNEKVGVFEDLVNNENSKWRKLFNILDPVSSMITQTTIHAVKEVIKEIKKSSNKSSYEDLLTTIKNVDKGTKVNHQLAADKYFLTRIFGSMWWQYDVCKQWNDSSSSLGKEYPVYIVVEIETDEGTRVVGRIEKRTNVKPLNPMLSYPDGRATKMRIGYIDEENNKAHEKEFKLEPFAALACSVYVDEAVKPIEWWNDTTDVTFDNATYIKKTNGVWDINRVSFIEDRRNVLKVSSTQSPLYFPAENTYQVGNGEILGLCANTKALSEGQWGDAPLYVFCSDGIQGLFVDSTGQLCYPNSRPISREVCNNPHSITPIDDAVVYSSNRGLFMISGAQNVEISKPAEGNPLRFTDSTSTDYLESSKLFLDIVANQSWLTDAMANAPTTEDFKEYIKNAECGWGYDHTELWVSNHNKDYTYIFSDGGWSKVMRKIDYYINDYPRTYYISNNKVYDQNNNDNSVTDCFMVSRPMVVNGETAKTLTRAWLYGDFDVESIATSDGKKKHKASIIVYGSHDGSKFSYIGIGGTKGRSRNIVAKLHRMSMRYMRIVFVGRLKVDSLIECFGVDFKAAWGEDSTTKVR